MDKLIVVIRREFMERIRSRWFIVMTLLMPALMAAVLVIPALMAIRSSASPDINRIIILDATGTDLGAMVLSNLKLDPAYARSKDSVAPAKPDVRVVAAGQLAQAESLAMSQVQKPHSYAGYLSLKDSTLINGAAHYAGRNAATPADMDRIESALRQSVMMVRLGKEGVRPAVIKDLAKIRVDVSAERISETGKAGSATAALAVAFFLAFLLYASIIFHGQNVLRGVQEEKSTRVAEVVLSSVKPDTLLAGKVLGVGAVGLVQQVLWLVITSVMITYLMPLVIHSVHTAVADTAVRGGPATTAIAAAPAASPALAVLNVITPQLIGVVLAFFFSGFIFYASLFAAAGAMVNSDQEANQAAMPIMMLLIFTIIFLNPIIANATGPLAIALSWIPFSSPIVMPTRVAIGAAGLGEAAGAWIVSVLGCFATVWVGARIYRVGMLMYGKRPNFRELVKWVRIA